MVMCAAETGRGGIRNMTTRSKTLAPNFMFLKMIGILVACKRAGSVTVSALSQPGPSCSSAAQFNSAQQAVHPQVGRQGLATRCGPKLQQNLAVGASAA